MISDRPNNSPSAGPTTFMVPGSEFDPHVLEYSEFNREYVSGQMHTYLDGAVGGSLAVSASGAEVPAFSETIHVPAALRLTAPVGTGFDPLELTRSQDAVFSWAPTAAGLRVTLLAKDALDPDDPVDYRVLACDFDGSAGTGTVPKELLEKLRADELGAAHIQLAVVEASQFDAGRFRVTLHGSQYLVGVDNQPYERTPLLITEGPR